MWGKLRGEEAFYAMLRVSEGEFALDPNFRAPEVVISASPEALVARGDETDRRGLKMRAR